MADWFEPARTETLHVAAQDDFGQGDILNLSSASAPPYLGVIINADCDLANKKTDGVVSYLPIYSFREYLTVFWMQEFLENQRSQLLSNIHTTCEAKDDDPEWLINWMSYADDDTIVKSLIDEIGLEKKAKTRLTKLVETYRTTFYPRKEAKEEFSLLCNSQGDGVGYATKQIQGAYNQMGDGHLVLNMIEGVDEMGFVVRMRRIYSIDVKNCFKSDRDERLREEISGDAAVRISKLSPVFQFKLAQLFAYQFSRVGLPDDFVRMYSMVLEELAEQLVGNSV